ncbi:hypothetical protein [Aliiroseovarius sp. S1339]|uniref:hypothetical protein n=1 Tax=Aliiroseovarius sp. S1339 TaxID=2936990 RepID=UPI0020BFD24B|nr:hypothetical protein [Aliiroseovarius sp. S1339]
MEVSKETTDQTNEESATEEPDIAIPDWDEEREMRTCRGRERAQTRHEKVT